VTAVISTPHPNPVRGLRRPARAATVLFITALVAAACGSDPDEPEEPPASGAGLAVCPDPVVAQTGWWPEAERGALYHLLGDDYTIDTDGLRVTGPLVAAGEDTGVRIEIRAGGPAIGFQLGSAQLHADDDIMLADVISDEAVSVSGTAPVLSVVAFQEIFPIAIMWDPQTYPEFETVADIGQTNTTVLAFGETPHMEYLIDSGVLNREQVDGSYDGTPSRWVAENGRIAQEGFATSEPYVYEHELPEWGKPVRFQLIYDLGYRPYYTLAVRADRKDELASCLEWLVPIIQQAMIDYLDDPAATNQLIVELADAYSGFPYSPDTAAYSAQQIRALGVVGNGANATAGDFDLDRVEQLLGIVAPIYTAQGQQIPTDLTAEDIATNEFIDPNIGLP
jgi:hypothetical protein